MSPPVQNLPLDVIRLFLDLVSEADRQSFRHTCRSFYACLERPKLKGHYRIPRGSQLLYQGVQISYAKAKAIHSRMPFLFDQGDYLRSAKTRVPTSRRPRNSGSVVSEQEKTVASGESVDKIANAGNRSTETSKSHDDGPSTPEKKVEVLGVTRSNGSKPHEMLEKKISASQPKLHYKLLPIPSPQWIPHTRLQSEYPPHAWLDIASQLQFLHYLHAQQENLGTEDHREKLEVCSYCFKLKPADLFGVIKGPNPLEERDEGCGDCVLRIENEVVWAGWYYRGLSHLTRTPCQVEDGTNNYRQRPGDLEYEEEGTDLVMDVEGHSRHRFIPRGMNKEEILSYFTLLNNYPKRQWSLLNGLETTSS